MFQLNTEILNLFLSDFWKFMLDKDFDEIQAKAEDLDEADDWGP